MHQERLIKEKYEQWWAIHGETSGCSSDIDQPLTHGGGAASLHLKPSLRLKLVPPIGLPVHYSMCLATSKRVNAFHYDLLHLPLALNLLLKCSF